MAKNSTLFSDNEKWNDGRMEEWKNEIPIFQRSIIPLYFSPSDGVIRNILGFSKALMVEKSKDAGLIEVILN